MYSSYHSGYFEWGNLSIRHSDKVFKVGTDAILLGSWIPTIIKDAAFITDIGTGTGILALKMSSCYPDAGIDAIDNDEHAVSLAETNVVQNGVRDKVNVYHEDVFGVPQSGNRKYDLAVCNPPYFFGQLNNPNNPLTNARHATMSARKWIKALCLRIKSGGHICIILPYEITYEWIRAANNEGLYIRDRLDVFAFRTDTFPKRSLLHLSEGLVKPWLGRITMYQKDGKEIREYLEFTGIKRTLHQKDATFEC